MYLCIYVETYEGIHKAACIFVSLASSDHADYSFCSNAAIALVLISKGLCIYGYINVFMSRYMDLYIFVYMDVFLCFNDDLL